MHHCLRPSPSAANDTPQLSSQPSLTLTNSFREIWSILHPDNSSYRDIESEKLNGHEEQQLLAQILHPDRECVQEALRYARPSTLTRLVSDYFNQSEDTSRRCLCLHHSVRRARSLYAPLHDLLAVLPLDLEFNSLTPSQCDRAFDLFLEFDSLENPFPLPDSHNFHDMHCCSTQLKQQLDCCLSRSRSRVRLIRRATTGSAICLIGAAVGVAISAVGIATHALVALVAGPFLPAFLPSKITKKELAHLAQLDAAKQGTYFLHHHLDTVDRMVACLHTKVEGDKLLIRLGLERGRDKHPILEVAKQLRKNHLNFLELDEHLCHCFTAINRARSLLREIYLDQTHFPNQFS